MNNIVLYLSLTFKKNFFVLIFREEKNIDVRAEHQSAAFCMPTPPAPYRGSSSKPLVCALTQQESSLPPVSAQDITQPTEPHGPGHFHRHSTATWLWTKAETSQACLPSVLIGSRSHVSFISACGADSITVPLTDSEWFLSEWTSKRNSAYLKSWLVVHNFF